MRGGCALWPSLVLWQRELCHPCCDWAVHRGLASWRTLPLCVTHTPLHPQKLWAVRGGWERGDGLAPLPSTMTTQGQNLSRSCSRLRASRAVVLVAEPVVMP